MCVCREEWCFCDVTSTVPLPAAAGAEWECPSCAGGNHVWTPGGLRSAGQQLEVQDGWTRLRTEEEI